MRHRQRIHRTRSNVKHVTRPVMSLLFDVQATAESAWVGNTFPFSKGGMFFASETDATMMWEGEIEQVQCYANDNCEFCYTAVLFGGLINCSVLRRSETGDYTRIFDGECQLVKAVEIKDGRTFWSTGHVCGSSSHDCRDG